MDQGSGSLGPAAKDRRGEGAPAVATGCVFARMANRARCCRLRLQIRAAAAARYSTLVGSVRCAARRQAAYTRSWAMNDDYPVRLSIDYPARQLNRLTSALRIVVVIPIAIVLAAIGGYSAQWGHTSSTGATTIAIGGTGLLFLPPLLMIVFRQKYPRWWFDWNLQLLRFANRVGAYAALMDDRYPATDEEQSVHLDFAYPDARQELNRWLPLVKWLLAIPHYVVLFLLYIGVVFALIAAWFAILFTGRYPRGLFSYVEGVIRWHNRVVGYAFALVTDRYPPFRLAP
jgi:hypothetical protein